MAGGPEVNALIELEVLNTGAGHLRLTFDPGEPEEVAKARETIALLLRRGFALFIQEGGQTVRVRAFDPERGSYYVDAAAPEDLAAEAETLGPAEPAAPLSKQDPHNAAFCVCGRKYRHRGPCKGARARGWFDRRRTKEVPAAGTKATAVGRTAGG